LVLASWGAKDSVRVSGDVRLLTMLADTERLSVIGQHEAKHHLNAQQERMKIPYNRRLVQLGDVMSAPVIK